jgi:CO/xanthine dehydrogenase Mo-binding subunit
MEPRGCIADYDPGTRRYTLYTSTQNVHRVISCMSRKGSNAGHKDNRVVTAFAACAAGVPLVAITATRRRTRSAASAGSRS